MAFQRLCRSRLRVAFDLQRGKKAERTGHSCSAAPSFVCGDCAAIRCINGWLADLKCTCSTALASYCRCRRPDLQIVVPCSVRRYLDAVQAAGEFWSKGSFGVILLKPWQASEIDAHDCGCDSRPPRPPLPPGVGDDSIRQFQPRSRQGSGSSAAQRYNARPSCSWDVKHALGNTYISTAKHLPG